MTEKKFYRSASWEVQQNESISGYALVFGQRAVLYRDPETTLDYGEIIDRHALDGADLSDVVLKYNHEGRVLARTRNRSLSLSIDDHGLKIEADMSGSDAAKSVLQDIRSGLLDKMSFAFIVAPDGEQWDAATRTRTVTKIERIFDVAVVDFPAYEQTEVSARSMFQSLAEPERRAYRIQQVNKLRDELQAYAEERNISDPAYIESGWNPWGLADPEEEAIREKKRQLATRFVNWKGHVASFPDDLSGAQAFATEWRKGDEELRKMQSIAAQHSREARIAVANGAAEPLFSWKNGGFEYVGDHNATFDYGGNTNMKNTETRAFFSGLLEKRAAGTTNTLSALIPNTVLDNYVIETAPGAFLTDSQTTVISHSGDLSIPIASLQEVSVHEENAEIEANGYTPGMLTIHHREYAYNVGYSRSGVMLSVDSFMNIVSSTLMGSMMKKMDGICYEAVAGLNYTAQNSVTVSAAPAFEDFVAVAGKLGTDYIARAKWYMSSSTYFNWVMGLKDSNKKPVFDPSKKIEEQALLGYPLAIDSHVPENTIYFGDGSRVYLNYADPVKLVLWTDYDHNTEKAGVNTIAGAAVEIGSFIKLSK